MPTYQYLCTSCAEPLEAVQRFADGPLTVCPGCEGILRKVFSPVGVVFKGSGFYKTDSRAKRPSTSAPKPDAGKADAGKADAGKAEPKAATPETPSTPAPSEGRKGSVHKVA